MAPNASSFVNFFSNPHAFSVHKNVCHQLHNNYNNYNNGSALFHYHLKSIKENFVTVNSNFLKDNFFESVSHFSSASISGEEKNHENKRLDDMRSLTAMRLELIRKALVKQTVREKLDMWQKKKDEMSRMRQFAVSFKPKFQREEILVKKENYEQVFNEIHKRSNTGQTTSFDHQQRCREIFFKATLARAILTASAINNYLGDPQLVLNIGNQIDIYRSMELRLGALKNVAVEAPLVAAKSLLEDLTLYKNNVVMPIQAELETRSAKINIKRNSLNKFSVNIPNDNLVKHVRRQYVALVKNNKLLIDSLTKVKNVPFNNDPTTKLFRQNVVKVVNTLVNTISSTNAAHLTDKYNKLNALLSGKLVCVANTQVMIGNNKEALAFCMETLSKKIISYAEEVICVKAQAAYEIVAVITRLWSVHQQFGKVLFAEIKHKCPLLVPFCYPVAKSLTYEELDHKSFGYKIDSSGNIESDTKFLKRMTGIVRLYAALIVASTKYNLPVIGLSQAWIFISGTLNQNPVADITATMLVEFLNIVGFEMHQAYGKQFIKLLQYINTYYLEKIILVTPVGHGGPITRLNSFVSKCLQIGSVEEPKGVLSADFW